MYDEIVSEIRKKNYSTYDVKEAAEKILSKSDMTIPVKIVEICNQMGFNIYRQNLPPQICGYIMIDGELKDKLQTDRIISVNERESNKRRRFTVAHELAHYLFDFDPEKSIQFFNKFELNHENGNEDEGRANRFAAELLMPETNIKEQFQKLANDKSKSNYDKIQTLSDIFLTPPKSVEIRLREELHLL